MSKLATSEWGQTNTKDHGQGKTRTITTGKLTPGGGKLGTGKKLKAMMVWKDTGKKGAY
jgi:hypothetical protein